MSPENNEPVHFNYGNDQTHNEEINEDDNKFNEELPADKDIPVMLWWTPFTMVKQTRKCNLGECYTTEDRTLQNDSRTRVFLFYGTDFSASDVPLPREGKRSFELFFRFFY